MTSSTHLNGNRPERNSGNDRPYLLAVTSHKGGTGRTTLALALAWMWGKRGLKVTLIDADPVKAASLVAAGPAGICPWDNVTLVTSRGGTTKIPPGQDLVVIDSPPATEPLAQQVLRKANGVVVCCLADTLALNTLPMATRAVREARETNEDLELLGIVVGIFDQTDLAQTRALSQLRGARSGLLIEPAIPLRPELREWPLSPGSDLPDGPARPVLRNLEGAFRDRMIESGWTQFDGRTQGEASAYAARR
ncbi:MAG: ParA family protein [Gemmataceae bacterium]